MKIQIAAAAAMLSWNVASADPVPAPGTSADKAALERAQQLADGPRRRILEAAKLKTVARSDAAVMTVPALVLPAPASVAVPARHAEPEPVVATLRADVAPLPLSTASVSLMPALAPVELAVSSAAMIALPTPIPALNLANLPPPRLVSRVDPELPSRVFRRGAGRTEVVVDLVVNADGSVRDIAVRPGSNAEFESPVIDAVRQWRYEAQPAARAHVVRLVVSPG